MIFMSVSPVAAKRSSHKLGRPNLAAVKKAARRVSASSCGPRVEDARRAFGFLPADAAAKVICWPEL